MISPLLSGISTLSKGYAICLSQFMGEIGANMEEAVWRMTGITVDENDRLLLE